MEALGIYIQTYLLKKCIMNVKNLTKSKKHPVDTGKQQDNNQNLDHGAEGTSGNGQHRESDTSQSQPNSVKLNYDTLLHLFSFLSLTERVRLRRICSEWRAYIDTMITDRLAITYHSKPHDIRIESFDGHSYISANSCISVRQMNQIPPLAFIPHVKLLALDMRNLAQTLQYNFTQFTALKCLEIESTGVHFPENLRFPSVTHLTIRGTCKNCDLLAVFPSLTRLYCKEMALITLLSQTPARNLRDLTLSRFMGHMRASKVNALMPNLQRLSIAFHSVENVCDFLANLPHLEHLQLICTNTRHLWSCIVRLLTLVDNRVSFNISFKRELDSHEMSILERVLRRLQDSHQFHPVLVNNQVYPFELDHPALSVRGITNLYIHERNKCKFRDASVLTSLADVQRIRYDLKSDRTLLYLLQHMPKVNNIELIHHVCEDTLRQVQVLLPNLHVLHMYYENAPNVTFDVSCISNFQALESLRIYGVNRFVNAYCFIDILNANPYLSKMDLGLFDFRFDWTRLAKELVERSLSVPQGSFELHINYLNEDLNCFSVETFCSNIPRWPENFRIEVFSRFI